MILDWKGGVKMRSKLAKRTLIIVLGVCAVLAGLLTGGPAAQEPGKEKSPQKGRIGTIGKGDAEITVLYLEGGPYEMGFQHGKLLKDKVKACLSKVLDNCYKQIAAELLKGQPPGLARPLANAFMDEAYKKMEPFVPDEYKEEMKGLAEGADVPLADVRRVHAIPAITENSCSAFAAFGKATKDGKLYQIRVLDYIMNFGLQDYPLITVYKPEKGNAFVNVGWVGFTGVVSGMNAKGLAVSEMGYGKPGQKQPGIPEPQPEETLEGFPMIFLLKKILQRADDVEEATKILKEAKGTNYYVYVIGDGITQDGKPAVRGYIMTKDFCKVYEPDKDSFPLPTVQNAIYGSHYNDRCYSLLKKLHGEIEPKVIMKKIIPEIAMESNLQSVVYEPADLKLWVANAKGTTIRACDRDYVPFDFGKALGK